MRRWGVLALLLLAAACKQQGVDRNANVAQVDLNKVVTEAKARAEREHPGGRKAPAPATTKPGYAWVGDWARRRTLCPFRKWHLTRVTATLPRNEICAIRSVKGEVIGGDRIELSCETAGMKTGELWFAKFTALDQLRITRTVGSGVPGVVTLVRCR